ncbi:uncharacterized protein MELLADRAFT_109577 [Melampsora larici-populina 98AG31]|uniref:Uncharacterized protein n=1 Tax=Melampsora larici-populina (strain 98AG31 / pathotype 3-4-7) TaxID=747676 RepID=F4RWX9_MELLP|nr:uncharacterized protein MELLADRAFT_109577 [Melampsora larici-populina 98AG31]EGG03145.1 hypothetical protein MELLADRAFT_109577 [Melampsora larici-populina 98AG31]
MAFSASDDYNQTFEINPHHFHRSISRTPSPVTTPRILLHSPPTSPQSERSESAEWAETSGFDHDLTLEDISLYNSPRKKPSSGFLSPEKPYKVLNEAITLPLRVRRETGPLLNFDDERNKGLSTGPFGHQLIRISSKLGLQGKDVGIVMNELHRHRNSKRRSMLKKYSILVGLITLAICGGQVWMLVKVVISLLGLKLDHNQDNIYLKTQILWSQLGVYSFGILTGFGVLVWARMARRASAFSDFLLIFSAVSSVANIAMALNSLILVLILKQETSVRCNWGFDFTWSDTDPECKSTDSVITTEFQPWVLASSVRVLITIIVSILWLVVLGKFKKVLSTTAIVEPTLSSKEVQQILNEHQTVIVALNAGDDAEALGSNLKVTEFLGSDQLPHMPQREEEKAYNQIQDVMGGTHGIKNMRAWNDHRHNTWGNAVNSDGSIVEHAEIYIPWPTNPEDENEIPDYEELSIRHDSPARRSIFHHPTTNLSPSFSMRVTYDYANPEENPTSTLTAKEEQTKFKSFVKSLHWRRKVKGDDLSGSCFQMTPSVMIRNESNENEEHQIGTPRTASSISSGSYSSSPDLDVENDLSLKPSKTIGQDDQAVFIRMNDGRLVRKLSTIASAGSQEIHSSSDQFNLSDRDQSRSSVMTVSDFTVGSGFSI